MDSKRRLRMPIIMISAHGEISDAVTALKEGAQDYIVKPFDPEELVLRLKNWSSFRIPQCRGERKAVRRTARASFSSAKSPQIRQIKKVIERSPNHLDGAHHRGKRYGKRGRRPKNPTRPAPSQMAHLSRSISEEYRRTSSRANSSV